MRRTRGPDAGRRRGRRLVLSRGAGGIAPARRVVPVPRLPPQLIDAVLDALRPLQPGGDLSRDDLADLLDLLVSGGDLLELRQSGDAPGASFTSGRPRTSSGGQASTCCSASAPSARRSSAQTSRERSSTRATRGRSSSHPDRAAAQLSELGLHMIRPEHWVRRPAEMPAGELIRQMRERLSAAGPAGLVEGLTVIDPAAKVTYYRGRWRPLKPADSGLFVARRPQAYGADLWCVVLVAGGAPVRLLDLPADDPDGTGSRRGLARPGCTRRRSGAVLRCSASAAPPAPAPARGGRSTSSRRSPGGRSGTCNSPGWPFRVPRGRCARTVCPRARMPGLASFLEDMLWMRQRNDGGAE